jgi:hypothetical protein
MRASYSLQLAAYIRAWEEMNPDHQVSEGWVVRFHKNDTNHFSNNNTNNNNNNNNPRKGRGKGNGGSGGFEMQEKTIEVATMDKDNISRAFSAFESALHLWKLFGDFHSPNFQGYRDRTAERQREVSFFNEVKYVSGGPKTTSSWNQNSGSAMWRRERGGVGTGAGTRTGSRASDAPNWRKKPETLAPGLTQEKHMEPDEGMVGDEDLEVRVAEEMGEDPNTNKFQ